MPFDEFFHFNSLRRVFLQRIAETVAHENVEKKTSSFSLLCRYRSLSVKSIKQHKTENRVFLFCQELKETFLIEISFRQCFSHGILNI